ncbi:uncharacterized protein LTR77_002335 [Saxophila tyrrhenica]|uniref:Uncharacterized protein n=1 Tax=Saxophila tyrrhenica TaxID=1690608 RepID=A0AAV9PIB3_9PEZI|nr:hypothetical protein LTR77_002335 [Saxophila tyrrhenica]
MARYPTFEEYQKSGKYNDGLKRTADLLKKAPNDPELLILKAQLLSAKDEDPTPTLDGLQALQPPIQDLNQLIQLEQLHLDLQKNDFPIPKTLGPQMAKFWDLALEAPNATTNSKLDALSLRFSQGIANTRLEDAQQALIQLKVMQPRNRVLFMAHAAVTYLLSGSKEDLQARLALGLARKAVKEGFDGEEGLDCRVPGQILAVGGTGEEVLGLEGRRFGESKQVYEALRRGKDGGGANREVKGASGDGAKEGYEAEVAKEKERFAELVKSDAKIEEVISFASDALQLFHKGTKSSEGNRRRLKVDACFLAVSGLVRAFELTDQTSYLLNAAHITEALLAQNEHIHESRLILVYLYMRLNLGSLALHLFDSLRVKEIQNDTVGHALFTRLSLVHPYSTGQTKKETLDPLKMVSNALQMYIRCEDKLAETQAGVLAHGQTGMVFDLQELRDKLRTSLSRRITFLEQRRIDRLVYNEISRGVAELGPRVTANWTEIVDNRDFAATFNYGCNVEKVLQSHGGSVPGEQWILNALVADAAWCLAHEKPPPVLDLQVLLDKTKQAQPDVSQLQLNDVAGSGSGMNTVELRAGFFAHQTLQLLLNLDSNSGDLADHISALSSALATLNIASLTDSETTLTEGLQQSYAYLDVLRTAYNSLNLAKRKGTGQAEALEESQKDIRSAFEALQTHAKERAKKVKAADVKAVMVKDEKIAGAVGMFGTEGLDGFCETVAKAGREGWEGVGRVKLA